MPQLSVPVLALAFQGQASATDATAVVVLQPTAALPAPRNIAVSDTRGLNAALKAASSGETILLKSGQYDGVSVNGIVANGVTIASADPTHPATLTRFYIKNSSGLTFSRLVFSTEGSNDP